MISNICILIMSFWNSIFSCISSLPSSIIWLIGLTISFISWVYLWRPNVIIEDQGSIKFGEDIIGSKLANSNFVFKIKNIGKRSARISNFKVIGYHDSGDDIETIKNGEMVLKYFVSENLKTKNPLPPEKTRTMNIELDIIGASINRIFIKLGYFDSDIKIYHKQKKFYYLVNDGNVEEMLDDNLARFKKIIKIDNRESKQSSN